MIRLLLAASTVLAVLGLIGMVYGLVAPSGYAVAEGAVFAVLGAGSAESARRHL